MRGTITRTARAYVQYEEPCRCRRRPAHLPIVDLTVCTHANAASENERTYELYTTSYRPYILYLTVDAKAVGISRGPVLRLHINIPEACTHRIHV